MINSTYILYFIVIIIAIFLVIKVFSWPLKLLGKLVINGLLGFILLFAINFLGQYVGIHIAVNVPSAIIAGFFGIPGVIFLIMFKMIM